MTQGQQQRDEESDARIFSSTRTEAAGGSSFQPIV